MWTLKLQIPAGTRLVVGQPLRVPVAAIEVQAARAGSNARDQRQSHGIVSEPKCRLSLEISHVLPLLP